MVKLGILNSRMKDYFDLWVLARHSDFDGAVLATAIRATFERRGTAIPPSAPLGLTDEFGLGEQKTKQRQAFQRKNTLEPMPLTTVIAALREFLLPVLPVLTALAAEGLEVALELIKSERVAACPMGPSTQRCASWGIQATR